MNAAPLLVAGPNLTIDRTATIPELRPGEVLRTREVTVSPGGKGVNVVRYATALGASAEVVGFVAGRLGSEAAAMLTVDGVALHAVPCGGEIRSSSILHEDSGRITVLNEPGPPVTSKDREAFDTKVAEAIGRAALLVCSGSAPPGFGDDGYGRLVALARQHRRPAIVDASGALLAQALAVGPDVITPNLAEAETLLGGRGGEGVEFGAGQARRRALAAAARLIESGPRVVVVTAGAAGAALAVGSSWEEPAGRGAAAPALRWFPAHEVRVRNPIGAGDAFVAGFAVALANGERPEDAVHAGMASAAASTEHWWPGRLDNRRASALRLSRRSCCGPLDSG